jgi:hypothetical protein
LDNKSKGLNTARESLAGCGTQTAALGFGGIPPVTGATEEYDGSTWTSNPTGLNTARDRLAGCGTQTAALAFGGLPPITGATEEYDGSTWTSNPTGLNTARSWFSRLWYTNSRFSILVMYHLLQEQQKNMMVFLGQQILEV